MTPDPKFTQNTQGQINRGAKGGVGQRFKIGGVFRVKCYGADGGLKWDVLAKNGVTNVGLNSILDQYFRSGSTFAGWALGLINGSSPTLAAGDTHASHGGWTEFVAYSETERPEWAPDAPVSQSLVNPSFIDYSINGSGTTSGVFIAGGTLGGGATHADLKGSTNATPLLWATALFTGGAQSVNSGDTLRVTYTVNASST